MSDTLNAMRSRAGLYPTKFNQRESALAKTISNGLGAFTIVAAGEATTAGGAAAEDISLSGVLASDLCICTLQAKGATPRTILTAATDADKITVTWSGDPSTDHVVTYLVLRALS